MPSHQRKETYLHTAPPWQLLWQFWQHLGTALGPCTSGTGTWHPEWNHVREINTDQMPTAVFPFLPCSPHHHILQSKQTSLLCDELFVWTRFSYATVSCRVWLLPRHRTPTPRARGSPGRCWPSPVSRDAESHRPLCTGRAVQGKTKQLQLCEHLWCQKRTF